MYTLYGSILVYGIQNRNKTSKGKKNRKKERKKMPCHVCFNRRGRPKQRPDSELYPLVELYIAASLTKCYFIILLP